MVDKSSPITSFRGDNWIFSNMYEHPITFNSLTYRNAEESKKNLTKNFIKVKEEMLEMTVVVQV